MLTDRLEAWATAMENSRETVADRCEGRVMTTLQQEPDVKIQMRERSTHACVAPSAE
jgi:hypothetical protein